eukprot:gene36443-47451_t
MFDPCHVGTARISSSSLSNQIAGGHAPKGENLLPITDVYSISMSGPASATALGSAGCMCV